MTLIYHGSQQAGPPHQYTSSSWQPASWLTTSIYINSMAASKLAHHINIHHHHGSQQAGSPYQYTSIAWQPASWPTTTFQDRHGRRQAGGENGS